MALPSKVIILGAGIIVLRLTYKPDQVGHTTPPECHVRFNRRTPVTYGEYKVGTARLYRKQNEVLADLTLKVLSTGKNKAMAEVQKLSPAVGMIINKCVGDTFFDVTVDEIILSPYANNDFHILPLGHKISFKARTEELN